MYISYYWRSKRFFYWIRNKKCITRIQSTEVLFHCLFLYSDSSELNKLDYLPCLFATYTLIVNTVGKYEENRRGNRKLLQCNRLLLDFDDVMMMQQADKSRPTLLKRTFYTYLLIRARELTGTRQSVIPKNTDTTVNGWRIKTLLLLNCKYNVLLLLLCERGTLFLQTSLGTHSHTAHTIQSTITHHSPHFSYITNQV